MPLQTGHSALLERGDFFHGFLDVVFAKGHLSGCSGLFHRLWTKSFGHRQQLHCAGRAGRLGAGLGQTLFHSL